jgi:acetoin utilization protein AcuA
MEHLKTVHQQSVNISPKASLCVKGPVTSEEVRKYSFHDGLHAFRPPEEQQRAIAEIADLPEGRIIQATNEKQIVAYVTFLYPDPLERWSEGNMEDLLELGAIEVAPPYRSHGVSKALLKTAFADDYMEHYIVISTEYYWHWDLKGTGLSVWEYRKVMEKVMGCVGMTVFATDDSEITAHPANCLMARIGSRVPPESVEQFNRLRFQHRDMY